MKRKITGILLAVTMVLTTAFSSGAGAYAVTQVTDISGHRSEAAILEAIQLGVIKGYPDGTYRPDGLINREEFFSVINNILTVRPDTSATKLNFIDADPIEWYIPVVKTMVEANITNGIGWDKVGIGLKITRQEAVKILATIIPTKDLPAADLEILAKDKGTIATWALPYYQVMFKKGYLNNTEGTLGPAAELTREEAAILLLKIKKGETVIAGNANEISASVETGDGTGTLADPYRISTQEQLYQIREKGNQGAYFVLTKDITITKDFEAKVEPFLSSETDWSGGNFRPIGSKEAPFKGFFDGKGYTIRGLSILGTVKTEELLYARELASYVGLFGAIHQSSRISHLAMDDSQFFGKDYTGAIAGYSEGTLKNCGTGENMVVKGISFTGGIAGYNGLLIEKCYSKATVSGQVAAGAIVGRNYGSLAGSYWLNTSSLEAVGSIGMNSTLQEVKALTKIQFADQNIEKLLIEN